MPFFAGLEVHVSELNDPRVLFAAERTLLAWSRTASGLIAFGFIIDRAAIVVPEAAARSGFGFWIGMAFIALGCMLCVASVVQYERAVAELRPAEIPKNYWVNLAVVATLAIGALGVLLIVYLALSR